MRDPRGHRINVVFVGKVVSGDAQSGGDAEPLEWYPVDNETHPLRLITINFCMITYIGKITKVLIGHQCKGI